MTIFKRCRKKNGQVKKSVSLLLIVTMILGMMPGGGSVLGNTSFAEDPAGKTFLMRWIPDEPIQAGMTINEDATVIDYKPPKNESRHVKYGVVFTLGGNQKAQPGEIEIRLPKSIFKGRDGNALGQFSSIGVPESPDKGNTSFNYTIDETADEIVLTNYEEVSESYKFECQVAYDFMPYQVPDNYKNDTIKAKSKVTLGETDPIVEESNVLTVNVDTDAKIKSISKSVSAKYEVWNGSWNSAYKPDNAGDYFYVGYNVYVYRDANSTQPYEIKLSEIFEKDGDGKDIGEIVYYNMGAGNVYGTKEELSQTVFFKEDQPNPNPVITPYKYATVVVKFPGNPRPETNTKFYNTIEANLKGIDHVDDANPVVDTKSSKALYSYQPVPAYADRFTSTKSTYGFNYGLINALELGKKSKVSGTATYAPYESSFIMNATFYADTLSQSGTKEYTGELIDDVMTLDDVRLLPGDYHITSAYLPSYNGLTFSGDPNTGTVATQSSDYATLEPLEVWYKTGSDWIKKGKIERPSSAVFKFTDEESGGVYDISMSNQIEFPEGAHGVKFVYKGKRPGVSFSPYINVSLNPTTNVKNIIKNKSSSTFRNATTIRAADSGGATLYAGYTNTYYGSTAFQNILKEYDQATFGGSVGHYGVAATMTRLDPVSSITKTSSNIKSDSAKGWDTADYTITSYESTNYSTNAFSTQEILDLKLISDQKKGVFYDLLPMGTKVKQGSVAVTTYVPATVPAIPPVAVPDDKVNVEYVENWKNSGQTMMIVKTEAPGELPNYVNTTKTIGYPKYEELYSGFVLKFTLIDTWDNMLDNGKKVLNSVAYQPAAGNIAKGFADTGGTLTKKIYFTDLDNDGNPTGSPTNTIYAQNETTFNPTSAAQLSSGKAVRPLDELKYTPTAEVSSDGRYEYRLRFANGDNSMASDVVLYDVIEAAHGANERWKGTFEGVDVSGITAKGIKAVVYYSTNEGLESASNANYRDLTDESIWSTDPPEDISTVTAIAIDMSKMNNETPKKFGVREGASALVKMKAPVNYGDYINPTVYAYNESSYTAMSWLATSPESSKTFSSDVSDKVKVSLRGPDIEISKTSDPVSGTELNPTSVEKGSLLNYTISVKNKNPIEAMGDILVYDMIPDGLVVNVDEIKYYTGADATNAEKITSAASPVVMVKIGQKLSFKISKLFADKIVNIVIPTNVDTARGMQLPVYTNKAVVTSINGGAYNVQSASTYHFSNTKTVNVKWEGDNNDASGTRPKDVKLQLMADGEPQGDPVTLNKENDWTYSWVGLDLLKPGGGTVVYTLKEVPKVKDYKVEYDELNPFFITYRYIKPSPNIVPGAGTGVPIPVYYPDKVKPENKDDKKEDKKDEGKPPKGDTGDKSGNNKGKNKDKDKGKGHESGSDEGNSDGKGAVEKSKKGLKNAPKEGSSSGYHDVSGNLDELPKTGGNDAISIYVVAILSLMLGFVLIYRKGRNEKIG